MENNSKYTLIRTVTRFFILVYKSFDSWPLMLSYAALCTIINYILKLGESLCSETSVQCLLGVNISMLLLLAFVFISYCFDFYQVTFNNSVFKAKSLISFSKEKMKSCVFVLCYLLDFIVSISIAYFILKKTANHDWRIEFIYFILFCIFCIIPIMLMRFSTIVSCYLNNQIIPKIKSLYNETSGRSYIGIVGFLFVVLILSLLNLQAYGFEYGIMKKYSAVGIVALVNFFDFIVKLFCINVLICFSEAQRQLICFNDSTATPFVQETIVSKPNKKTVKKKESGKSKKQRKKKPQN